jgi:prophage regulatory protein
MQLHPRKILRASELPEFTGLGRTQIATLIAGGQFPKPVRLSARRKGWLSDEVAEWQAERIAERDRDGRS